MQDLYDSALVSTWNLKEKGIAHPDLETILEESENQPSQEYYLRKTIALHNLYGVDIMDEAVEIARLRLFLALAATVDEKENLEPLPDLDMNIRCGNILVGCINTEDLLERRGGDWTVEEKLQEVKERAKSLRDSYRLFQKSQREKMDDEIVEFKKQLQQDMKALAYDLDRLYANADDQEESWDIGNWRLSHRSFHWLAEFPEAILDGGFSVVIGNPPFVNRYKIKYRLDGFETKRAPDIFAPCMERGAHLISNRGRLALIAPISLAVGQQFETLRFVLEQLLAIRWISAFDIIPGNLFKAGVRPVVFFGCKANNKNLFSSNLRRWRVEYRPYLFQTTCFAHSISVSTLKRTWALIGDERASVMLRNLQSSGKTIGNFSNRKGKFKVGRKSAMNLRFLPAFLTEPPCWDRIGGTPGKRIPQSHIKWLCFEKEFHQHAAFLIFAGRLGHLLWSFVGDAFHVTDGMLYSFPCDLDRLSAKSEQLAILANKLDEAQIRSPVVDRYRHFVGGFDIGKCRQITDQADQLIMKELGIGSYWPFVLLLDNRIVKSTDISVKTVHYWVKKWTPTNGPWDISMSE